MALDDLGSAVIIIVIFFLSTMAANLAISISKIKNNWDKYKCSPGIIPFAFVFGHDVQETFNECVKKKQSDNMSGFLTPLYDSLNTFAEHGADFSQTFEDLKASSNKHDESMGGITQLFTGKLNNIITAVSEMTARARDTFGKLGSSITIVYYFVQMTLLAIKGAWDGLIGTFVRLATAFV